MMGSSDIRHHRNQMLPANAVQKCSGRRGSGINSGRRCVSRTRARPTTVVGGRQVVAPVDGLAESGCWMMSKVPTKHHNRGTSSVGSTHHAEAELSLHTDTMGRSPGMARSPWCRTP